MTALDVELIGLSGYAGCGKDTVAAVLAECQWRRASFADPLRAALYALDPAIYDNEIDESGWETHRLQYLVDVWGWDATKRDYPEVRALLQRMGTEVGRNLFGENFWVVQALSGIADDGGTRYVFADCRFPNEADAIRERGGRVWRVTRPGYAPVNAHPSETALDRYPFDGFIDNDGDLDQLHERVMAELLLDSRASDA